MSTVLLLDDESQMGEIVSKCLEPLGVEVVQTETLLDTVLAANRIHPTVVLLDLRLAGADGLSFLAALRAEPSLRGVPIVAFSGHIERYTEALLRGVDGFIGKPFGCEALREAIGPFLHMRRIDPDAASA